jgi:hypothetical protein
VAAGLHCPLWWLVMTLLVTRGPGLFYYLRIVVALFNRPDASPAAEPLSPAIGLSGGLVLATAAVTLGYGPRYLHSTGQLHKGGPNTGLFIQLTADDARDADVPGQPYSFGVLKKAQAQGDLKALHRHGRRAMRIHLGADTARGLDRLQAAMDKALADIR